MGHIFPFEWSGPLFYYMTPEGVMAAMPYIPYFNFE
jgi:hypothetical protein